MEGIVFGMALPAQIILGLVRIRIRIKRSIAWRVAWQGAKPFFVLGIEGKAGDEGEYEEE